MSPIETRDNPFPGLRSFEPEEDYLFFGRERQIDELLRRLRQNRFLAVVGTSGSGKSSLVRAGLIPSLHGGAMVRAGSAWRVAMLRPGGDPLGNLSTALSACGIVGSDGEDDGLSRAFLATTLRASRLGLVESVRQARLQGDNVLVVVDQFEELFRFQPDRAKRDDADAFVQLLLAAVRCPDLPIYVVLTLRSDYIGNCMEFADLPEAVNEGLYLVPRLNRDELRAAIVSPVAVGGGTIAPRLVVRLLKEVGDNPDQLPILQHALMRTWGYWRDHHAEGEPLDLRHYEEIGTMAMALSHHAREAYDGLGKRGQEIAVRMFKALTDPGTDGRGIRRPVPLDEICTLSGATETEVAKVVESFRQPGRSFLMPPPDPKVALDRATVLDLSHESLMRIWAGLAGWVREEARSAQIYLDAALAAVRHEVNMAALWRDPELQIALTWREREKPTPFWARRYEPSLNRAIERNRELQEALKWHEDQNKKPPSPWARRNESSFDRALRFLGDSQKEREAQGRREVRQRRVLVLILAAATLLSASFGVYARYQQLEARRQQVKAQEERDNVKKEGKKTEKAREDAERSANEAERQRNQARKNELRAAKAEGQARQAEAQALSQRDRANLEAENARKEKSQAVDAQRSAETLSNLAQLASSTARRAEEEARRLGHLSAARALALRPAPDAQTAALFAVQAYYLHLDNGGAYEEPDISNALRQALVRLGGEAALFVHPDVVRALALSPDGTHLATGCDDGQVRLFDLSRPDPRPRVLGGFASGVRALAFVEGGGLAAASANGSLRLWDQPDPKSPTRNFPGNGADITALAFQPGGPYLALAGQGTVELWDRRNPTSNRIQIYSGSGRPTALAWSPDASLLAAGFAGGGALLWQLNDRDAVPAEPRVVCSPTDDPKGGIRTVAFDKGGALACGTSRGVIRWNVGGHTTHTLGDPGPSVNALSFDRDSSLLAAAYADGIVRLWAPGHFEAPPLVLRGHSGWVWAVAVDQNGKRVFSAGKDLRIWVVHSADLAAEVCSRLSRKALTAEEWRRNLPPDVPYQEACRAGR